MLKKKCKCVQFPTQVEPGRLTMGKPPHYLVSILVKLYNFGTCLFFANMCHFLWPKNKIVKCYENPNNNLTIAHYRLKYCLFQPSRMRRKKPQYHTKKQGYWVTRFNQGSVDKHITNVIAFDQTLVYLLNIAIAVEKINDSFLKPTATPQTRRQPILFKTHVQSGPMYIDGVFSLHMIMMTITSASRRLVSISVVKTLLSKQYFDLASFLFNRSLQS